MPVQTEPTLTIRMHPDDWDELKYIPVETSEQVERGTIVLVDVDGVTIIERWIKNGLTSA